MKFTVKILLLCLLIPVAAMASEIKVVSFNVNYSNDKIDETLALITRFDPDIILLQESTPKLEKEAEEGLPSGYQFSWYTVDKQNPGGGFAVISKHPIVGKKFLEKSAGAFGAQTLGVRLGDTTIHFMNIHLNPAPLPKPFSRPSALHSMMMNNKTQVLEIRSILRHYRMDRPTVIAGDLNSFPSRSAYKQLNSAGFIDAHLSCDKKAHAIATWKMTVDGNPLQGRFDYVFHNPLIEAKQFDVLENDYSDHALLHCTLKLKK